MALFGQIEERIKGKSLIVVPSGALTSLPFQVLLKTPGETQTSWLVSAHALTVLPSVASLKSLWQKARASSAPEPYLGLADPVLSGTSCGDTVVPDRCPGDEVQLASLSGTRSMARSVRGLEATHAYFRNGLADVGALKSRLCPLPDTAHEVGCVAKSLGAPETSLVLGRRMTEKTLKSLPLARYRILHFATHGLLAGETSELARNRAEPALVMTPPEKATVEDDGLLTASEVAQLQLDADWVVMSACNTAGGGEPGAEALSGLARAFFYAGSRALLVSHWPVNSYAATLLTSRTFAELKSNPGIGRSEAFRRATLALMNDPSTPWSAHPSVWAPFVLVGEGGAQR
jgi:CHAT domain-containing protein